MSMKLMISTGLLFLLCGTIAFASAQPKGRNSQPVQRPRQTYGAAYSGGAQLNRPTHGGVYHSGVPQEPRQVQAGFLQSRTNTGDKNRVSWNQRGGYNGYRIPEGRFQQYFGSANFFTIDSLPLLFVGGNPRFQYDGYLVTVFDPWPDAWGATWYQTDDVYLDYTTDGYYLYNRSHPGIGLAVTIAF